MLPVSSFHHPKKRRRLTAEEPKPGPSSEVLPLIAPQLVKKSSKDPNRGMYPHRKFKSHKKQDSPFPDFVKASDLMREKQSVLNNQQSKAYNVPGPSSEVITASALAKGMQPKSKKHKCESNKHCELSDDSDFEILGSSDSIKNVDKSNNRNLDNKKFQRIRDKRKKMTMTIKTAKITSFFQTIPNATKRKVSKVINSDQSKRNELKWQMKNEEMVESLTKSEQFFKKHQGYFGLVKTDEKNGIDYFNNIPDDIIEMILCQLPMIDLLKCCLVCSRWNDVIKNKMFIEWKKNYFKYKKGKDEVDIIKELNFSNVGVLKAENCLKYLIYFLGKGYNRIPSSDMISLLKKNPLGAVAEKVLHERFPDLTKKESKVWCILAIAVLISETVSDVCSLYYSLFSGKSSCLLPDIVDSFYCIATFLLYFQNNFGINTGFHYRLYYALYMIENHIPEQQRDSLKVPQGLPGQQSIHSYCKTENTSLTYEQVRILNHCFEPGQIIKIVALAGTGKTTTLLNLARLYPQIKFLNLVFNRAATEEAKRKFPPNVTCRTTHSLAYSLTGRYLRHKLSLKLHPYDLLSVIKHHVAGSISKYSYAKLVLSTIESFIISAAPEISLAHVPKLERTSRAIGSEDRKKILEDAKDVWLKMVNKDDLSVRITHDVYLKLCQLQKPKFPKYQCIMVDEAQDCNPVMLDIVLSQKLPVVIVGDPNQQIYGFRGAENALENIKASHTYYLTKSFRFGPNISYIASIVLERLLFKMSNTIVGNSNESYVTGQKTEGQYAIIARTNVRLFSEAVRMCCHKIRRPYEPKTINAAFAGGIKSYGFDQIVEIYRMTSKQKEYEIKDKFLAKFKCFRDLVVYAEQVEDSDLLAKIEVVNKYGHDTINYVEMIKEKCNHPIELANVVFTTAHKAKGLEFDTVCLTDDYVFNSRNQALPESAREEHRILYVALTRAKRSLLLSEQLYKFISPFERFEYLASSEDVQFGKRPSFETEEYSASPEALNIVRRSEILTCVMCAADFTPHTVLAPVRKKVILSDGRVVIGGPLCMKCRSNPFMRPEVHSNSVIMLLDPVEDKWHSFLTPIMGPLPGDPPIEHESGFQMIDGHNVFVINLNYQ